MLDRKEINMVLKLEKKNINKALGKFLDIQMPFYLYKSLQRTE